MTKLTVIEREALHEWYTRDIHNSFTAQAGVSLLMDIVERAVGEPLREGFRAEKALKAMEEQKVQLTDEEKEAALKAALDLKRGILRGQNAN